MGVPGNFADRAPAGLADTELFAVDAYRTEFDATVVEVDRDGGRVRLDRTAFYPTGGGQPHDLGDVVTEVAGTIDWDRRFALMRTHTALHILCGVIWADYGIPVTGGNMEPLKGRLDFPFPSMSADLGARVEQRINDEIAKAHEILVDFVPRSLADADPALIRTSANLIPQTIDPLRIIDIVGLDKQADGGTHVLSTAEVGAVRVTGTESKGKDNKRIRLEVTEGSNDA